MSIRQRNLGSRTFNKDLTRIKQAIGINTYSVGGLTPLYNPKELGAAGDGVTEDSTFISATDTRAAAGGWAYLPQGDYLISSPLTLTADWFVSPGATFKIDKFSIRETTYKWTLSTGGGTNEYYLELAAGGNPNIRIPAPILANGSGMRLGVVGELAAGECGFDDLDSLGFFTVYVRLSDGTDPDTKTAGYVEAGYVVDFQGHLHTGRNQIFSGNGLCRFNDTATPELYPEWYGAVGDAEFATNNGTDDQNPLTKTIQSVCVLDTTTPQNRSGSVIRLTKRYKCGALVVPIKSRVTIIGNGSARSGLLLKASVNDYALTLQGGYCTLENFRIDGNKGNNTTGGAFKIKSVPGFTTAYKMNFVRGIQYNMWAENSGQGHFEQCVFLYGGHTGARVSNFRACNFYTCTFEDNDAIGLLVEGSAYQMQVNCYGCYFEQNGGDPDAAGPMHIKLDTWQNDEYGGSGDSGFTCQGSYFNGQGATSTHIGVWIDGTDLHGIHITNNDFNDCGGGAFVIDSPPSFSEIGMNTLLNNRYVGTTPTPSIDTSAGGFQPWGFMLTEHAAVTIVTEPIDLTVTNTLRLYGGNSYTWLYLARVRVVWLSAATAAVTLRLGHSASTTLFYNTATSGSNSADDVDELTLAATGMKANATRTLRFNNTGTANGGSIRLIIDLYDWTQMP